MEKPTKERLERLKKALSIAYHERVAPEVGEYWQTRVMTRIKEQESINILSGYLELLEGFVWRWSPVALILIFILVTAITMLDFASDYAMVYLFSEDPLNYSIFEYIG